NQVNQYESFVNHPDINFDNVAHGDQVLGFCWMMDRVSPLPDYLLLKILSYLPTNEVRITSVLSKRWRSLWMLLPKLEYCCGNFNTETYTRTFPTSLTNLFYYIRHHSSFEIASNRSLHELNVVYGFLSRLSLPRRTYETLVVMHLSYVFLNVTLVPDSFKVLKTLHLLSMQYKGNDNESFTRLLSKCHVLEDLLIEYHDATQTFTGEVPSLQSLSVICSPSQYFCLNTPSLKHLKIEACLMKLCNIQKMPHIVTADLKILIQTDLLDLPGLAELSQVDHKSFPETT
ncbi:hypothetical protein HID58_012226, partial [Brassica napus]